MSKLISAILWLLVLLASSASPSTPDLHLSIRVDRPIEVGRDYAVIFRVENAGATGVYFKVPWKWASNGLYLVGQSETGDSIASAAVLFDIPASDVCTHLKALAPGEAIEFTKSLGWSDPLPTIHFPGTGNYWLRWIYDPKVYDSDKACATAGWPVWQGRLESSAAAVLVTR